ncbi:hypothetical protein B0A54_15338 [Friedmanniomyces endolithicus]|uniref:Uncharacterized protein n=1 Tax=Friedmanniomyces endolithicus TaxID=329885 RepID=A0A4U0U550_9PEZI|nr:hypothetical protein B0A54_15338 [Friedmanniomyces endolithicus]
MPSSTVSTAVPHQVPAESGDVGKAKIEQAVKKTTQDLAVTALDPEPEAENRRSEDEDDWEVVDRPEVEVRTKVSFSGRIPLEPVRSTQRGHYPITSLRYPPYLKALEPMLFEAIERCIGASERYIGETIMVGAYYDNYDDVSDDGDDYDEGSGDDDDEWVVIEHEDGEYPWELVGAEEDEDA